MASTGFHHRAFGDFQFEQLGRQAGGGQRIGPTVSAEIALAQLAGRDVDRDAQGLEAGMDPAGHFDAGGGQNPVADFDDQAGFLGDRNEAGRRDRAVGRVIPADQGFDPGRCHPGR